jgi:hypothetical protein
LPIFSTVGASAVVRAGCPSASVFVDFLFRSSISAKLVDLRVQELARLFRGRVLLLTMLNVAVDDRVQGVGGELGAAAAEADIDDAGRSVEPTVMFPMNFWMSAWR